jgi:hypothetical protein
MHVDTFVQVALTGVPLRSLARSYAEWMLGHTDERHRIGRLKLGIPRSWTPEQVMAGEALPPAQTLRADMRLTDNEMIARFVHRDDADGAILWHTVASAQRDGETLSLKHAVGRDAPRHYVLNGVASPPRVVVGLLDAPGVDVVPKELQPPLVTLRERVEEYVDHVLLSGERVAPLVVVSCDRGGAPPLVQPELLARLLRGIMAVAYLPTVAATIAFTDALERRGLGPEFRCFNGAIHTYGAKSVLSGDHRIWLGDSLRSLAPGGREQVVAGLLAHRHALRTAPPRFFNRLEEHERAERLEAAARLARRRPSAPPAQQETVSLDRMRALEGELEEAKVRLSQLVEDERQVTSWYHQAEIDRREADRRRDDAEASLEQERQVSTSLRDMLNELKTARINVELGDEHCKAVGALMSGTAKPLDLLHTLALRFPTRIVVLDSAYSSAAASHDFLHSVELGKLLDALASSYWADLSAGRGDQDARKHFGSKFAATESEKVANNALGRDQRTFRYKGQDILMLSHLKIGYKESTAETIRVHFHWAMDEQKIVIGWCGEHRHRV